MANVWKLITGPGVVTLVKNPGPNEQVYQDAESAKVCDTAVTLFRASGNENVAKASNEDVDIIPPPPDDPPPPPPEN